VDRVTVTLDGTPVDPASIKHLAPQRDALGRKRAIFETTITCPASGKHLIQARYLVNELWSEISLPLRFEVLLPSPPSIVALSDANGVPRPIEPNKPIWISTSGMKVRLGRINQGDRILAYLDGKPVGANRDGESCCWVVPLEGHITAGCHTLTMRSMCRNDKCCMTSEASKKVVFHYYDEEVYLLRPGKSCCKGSGKTHSNSALNPHTLNVRRTAVERASFAIRRSVRTPVRFASDQRGNGSVFRFVAYQQVTAATEAASFRDEAAKAALDAQTEYDDAARKVTEAGDRADSAEGYHRAAKEQHGLAEQESRSAQA